MPDDLKQALNQEPVPPDPADNGGTEPDPPQAPGEPLDPNLYDDGGVPWKNRAMEAQRKLQEEADKRQYAEQLLNQQRMAQSPQAPQPQQQDDPYDRLLTLVQTDAKGFIREFESQITSKWEKKLFEQRRQQSASNAFAKYPELRNPNSDLYRAVDDEIIWLRQAGFNPDQSPNLVELAADRVAKRMGGNGNQPPPTPPAAPPSRLPNLGTTPSKPPSQRPATPPPLRDTFKTGIDAVADDFSTEELQKIQERLRTRDQRGEFQLGES